METYTEITSILFHVIIGGIIAISLLAYWIVKDDKKRRRATKNPTEVDALQEPNIPQTPNPILI
jgi:Mg2+/citrate symporter